MVVMKLLDVAENMSSNQLLEWGKQLGLNEGDNVVNHIIKLNNYIKDSELVLCDPKEASVYWMEYPALTPPISTLFGLTVYGRPYQPLPEEADKPELGAAGTVEERVTDPFENVNPELLEELNRLHPTQAKGTKPALESPHLSTKSPPKKQETAQGAADWDSTFGEWANKQNSKEATDKAFEEAAMAAPADKHFPDELLSVVNQFRERRIRERRRAADKRAAARRAEVEEEEKKKKVAARLRMDMMQQRALSESGPLRKGAEEIMENAYLHGIVGGGRSYRKSTKRKRRTKKRRLSKKRKITKRKIYKR